MVAVVIISTVRDSDLVAYSCETWAWNGIMMCGHLSLRVNHVSRLSKLNQQYDSFVQQIVHDGLDHKMCQRFQTITVNESNSMSA
jgi:hypothetical protein